MLIKLLSVGFLLQTVDPERLKIARAKLETEPYNLDSWEVIARDGQLRKIDEARKIFEEVVDTFPTSGKFWKMFIEQEVSCDVRCAPSRGPLWLCEQSSQKF